MRGTMPKYTLKETLSDQIIIHLKFLQVLYELKDLFYTLKNKFWVSMKSRVTC